MNAPEWRWYREPVAWLVIALPLAGVLASVWLMDVAGGDHVVDAAPEEVQRTAQVQQRDLLADQRAQQLGLHATLVRVDDGLQVTLLGADIATARLAFVHPADQSRDLVATLDAGGVPTAAALAGFDPRVAWHVRLQSATGDWRLVGRWRPDRPDAAVDLLPAFGPDARAP